MVIADEPENDQNSKALKTNHRQHNVY